MFSHDPLNASLSFDVLKLQINLETQYIFISSMTLSHSIPTIQDIFVAIISSINITVATISFIVTVPLVQMIFIWITRLIKFNRFYWTFRMSLNWQSQELSNSDGISRRVTLTLFLMPSVWIGLVEYVSSWWRPAIKYIQTCRVAPSNVWYDWITPSNYFNLIEDLLPGMTYTLVHQLQMV